MLERSDIPALADATLQDLFRAPPTDPHRYLLRITSGTSSGSPILIATGYPTEAPAEMGGRSQQDPVSRMLTCNGSRAARLAVALLVRTGPEAIPMQVVTIDSSDCEQSLTPLIDDWKPDSIYGFCSFILRTLPFISTVAAASVRIAKFNGESLSDTLAHLFTTSFPHARQMELYIAAEGAGSIGKQCRFIARRHFHQAPGVRVEIDAPYGEEGDVLVSKRIFRDIHLTQYRIGDIGRVVAGPPCACGDTYTFELIGRKGIDYIKLAGALFRREEFDRVTSELSQYIRDYRAYVIEGTSDHRHRIILHAYQEGLNPTPALVQELCSRITRSLFISQTKTLYDFLSEGSFEPLMLHFVNEPFEVSRKEVKLRLLTAEQARSTLVI